MKSICKLSTDLCCHRQSLNLNQVSHKYWKSWKLSIKRLPYRLPPGVPCSRSLVLKVSCKCDAGEQQLSALVDTGAAVPIVFRRGLFAEKFLKKSVCPVKFVTASGQAMTGGNAGMKLQLTFPIKVKETTELVCCDELWAYEADLHSTDLILGYPFLNGFGLLIDTVKYCLVLSDDHALKQNMGPKVPSVDSNFGMSGMSVMSAVCQTTMEPKVAGPIVVVSQQVVPLSVEDSVDSPVQSQASDAVQEHCMSVTSDQLLQDSSRSLAAGKLQGSLWQVSNTTQDSLSTVLCQDQQCSCHEEVVELRCQSEVWTEAELNSIQSNCQFSNLVKWMTIPTLSIQLKQSLEKLHSIEQKFVKDVWKGSEHCIADKWFGKILKFSQMSPTVDAFAASRNARFEKFWTKSEDAFLKDWSQEILWIHPPFGMLDKVVQKILVEECQGILIIPCWKKFLWFTILEKIAVKWVDLPHDAAVFQDMHGRPILQRPRWTTRVVVFNAFGALSRIRDDVGVDKIWRSEGLQSLRSLIPIPVCAVLSMPLVNNNTHIVPLISGNSGSSGKTTLYSVIESHEVHPEAEPYVKKLQKEFHDVLYELVLARDVDPKSRGPFGVAHIELKPDAVPQKRKPFRMLGEKEEALKTLIQKFLDRGWIEDTDSEWGSQAFLVFKPSVEKSDAWRMVVDYRYVNQVTKDFPFPLPLIEDLICKEAKNRLWSIFDLETGFHQMHLAEDSRAVTAFVTPWGCYQWTVLPMGMKQAPALFQRLVNWSLREVPHSRAYVDDILTGTPLSAVSEDKSLKTTQPLLHGRSSASTSTTQSSSSSSSANIVSNSSNSTSLVHQHYLDVCDVLSAFRKYNLTVKGTKVHLFMKTIKFCGHVLSGGQRRAAPSKLAAIEKWTSEMIKTVTHLKGFLGVAQYYCQYVRNFADIALPLTEQLKSRKKGDNKIVWTSSMQQAFQKLKEELLKNAVLDIADPYKPYVLEVDASDFAVGGVLSQEDAQGQLRTVAFFSRKLDGSPGKGQVGWSIREKETYAIVLLLKKFRSWVASSKITVLTDHKALESWHNEDLNKMIGSVARRGRWHEFLSQFDLEVKYVPGKEHVVSDTLSRWSYPACLDTQDNFHGDEKGEAFAAEQDRLETNMDLQVMLTPRSKGVVRRLARIRQQVAEKECLTLAGVKRFRFGRFCPISPTGYSLWSQGPSSANQCPSSSSPIGGTTSATSVMSPGEVQQCNHSSAAVPQVNPVTYVTVHQPQCSPATVQQNQSDQVGSHPQPSQHCSSLIQNIETLESQETSHRHEVQSILKKKKKSISFGEYVCEKTADCGQLKSILKTSKLR